MFRSIYTSTHLRRLKIGPLIAVYLPRDHKTTHKFTKYFRSYCDSSLIGNDITLGPLCKVVYNKDKCITARFQRKWSRYVHGKASHRSTVSAVFFPVLFSTAVITNFDPPLDLCSKTLPEVSNSKCSQCLINTPVARSCMIMVSLKCSLLKVPWKYILLVPLPSSHRRHST